MDVASENRKEQIKRVHICHCSCVMFIFKINILYKAYALLFKFSASSRV